MEQWIVDYANNYGPLVYLVILVWTFLEGETVVLVTGALISGGNIHLNVWSLVFCAFLGSFAGDQTWFYVGRKYGTPLLKRWPTMADKVTWALKLLSRQENLFILCFRFIYGLRNISPFIIGMTGVSRTKFLILNLVAAAVWANTFAWGGYTLGKAMDSYMGQSSEIVLGVVVGGVIAATVIKKRRQRALRRAQETVTQGTPALVGANVDQRPMDH